MLLVIGMPSLILEQQISSYPPETKVTIIMFAAIINLWFTYPLGSQ